MSREQASKNVDILRQHPIFYYVYYCKGYFYELIVDFIFVLNQMTINQYSKDFKQQQHLCLLQCYYLLYCGNM